MNPPPSAPGRLRRLFLAITDRFRLTAADLPPLSPQSAAHWEYEGPIGPEADRDGTLLPPAQPDISTPDLRLPNVPLPRGAARPRQPVSDLAPTRD